MMSGLLRRLGILLYAGLVLVVFGLSAYVSFSLFVSSGVTTVPNLEGLSRVEAANVLADQGLALRKVDEQGRYDEKVPIGNVLRQTPDARTLVKRGSGVEVVLSLGPRRLEVPDLAGKAIPTVQLTLSTIGLGVGRTATAFAAGDPGLVVAQDPAPGVTVAPQTAVDLLLSTPSPGESWLMPDLVYRRYDDIKGFFERQGIRFGSVKYERYEGVSAGVILRQFPLPGHPLNHGAPVSLVVATAEGVGG